MEKEVWVWERGIPHWRCPAQQILANSVLNSQDRQYCAESVLVGECGECIRDCTKRCCCCCDQTLFVWAGRYSRPENHNYRHLRLPARTPAPASQPELAPRPRAYREEEYLPFPQPASTGRRRRGVRRREEEGTEHKPTEVHVTALSKARTLYLQLQGAGGKRSPRRSEARDLLRRSGGIGP